MNQHTLVPKPTQQQVIYALVAAFLAFAAAALQNRADMYNWSIGVSHDSIFYLDAAKNILAGLGIANTITGEAAPMTHYPPLYPIVLAVISFITGLEPLRAAYYLAIFLAGANTVLIAYLVYKHAAYNLLAGISAAGITIVSHAVVVTHYMAWSEPLFLCLVLSGILLLDKYLTTGHIRFLLLTGVLFALAIFTRYVGFILLPFAGLAILLFRRQSLVTHIKHIVLVGLPSVVLIGAWMLRNSLKTGKSTNRSIQFLGFSDARVTELKTTIRNWFFSDGSVHAGFNRTMLVLLIALILLLILYRKDIKANLWRHRPKLAELMLLFGLLYLAFLVVSVTFVDASTPLDDRMLVPLFVALLCTFLGVFWRSAKVLSGSKIAQVVLVLALAWFGYNRYGYTRYFHEEMRAHGFGFTGKEMREADAAAAIKKLPATAQLYAPAYDYVYLYYLTGRPIKPLSDLENHKNPVSNSYAAFLQPCCPDGNSPTLPAPYKAGEPVWGQHLYPIIK